MKKNHFCLMVMALVVMLFMGGNMTSQAQEEENLSFPCEDMQTTKGVFRGWGVGTSDRKNVARKKARVVALSELASSIESVVESTTENYLTEVGKDMDLESRSFFSEKIKSSVKRVIKGAALVCDQWRREGRLFNNYMVLEVSTEEIMEGISSELKKEKKGEKVDIDKLEEMFNDEFYERLEVDD